MLANTAAAQMAFHFTCAILSCPYILSPFACGSNEDYMIKWLAITVTTEPGLVQPKPPRSVSYYYNMTGHLVQPLTLRW